MRSDERYGINRSDVVYEMFEDDEAVIINLDNGNYYSTDRVGALIWSLIESGTAVHEITREVLDRYPEAGASDAEVAILESLADLHREGLILPDTGGRDNGAGAPARRAVAGVPTQCPAYQRPLLKEYSDIQEFLLVDPIHEVDYTDRPTRP